MNESERRVRVLEIAAEGAAFELDAELAEDGTAGAFFVWTGGPHGFEELFNEEPEPRISYGPFTWPEVLEKWLRPSRWLELHPRLLHGSIADRVHQELPSGSERGRARWSAKLHAARFQADIERAYSHAHCIHPFIGNAFAGGDESSLRVMTIGINAYLSDVDWKSQRPSWFSGWFRDGRHKFDRTVASDADSIAKALVAASAYFSRLKYGGSASIFHTNAVKSYLPESEGKRSDQLTGKHFDEHLPTWHAELDLMARHGVLPHVVLVFGRPFWESAWRAFHPETRPAFEHLTVHDFVSARGEGHHFANRIEVEGAEGRHALALLAVRHPAARATSKATPEWLLSSRDIRELFGVVAPP